MGYKRADGRIGIRNYVLVLSMVHCSNTVAQRIAFRTGAHAVVHDFGCVEFEDRHARTRLGLLKAALNPNVYGVLLVGLGCEQTDAASLLQEIRQTGKPVYYVGIQEEGGSKTAEEKGCRIVEHLVEEANDQKREAVPLSGLVVGVQCGGSDWTTGLAGNSTIGAMTDRIVADGGSVIMSEVPGFPGSEHIVAERAVNYEVGLQVIDMCDDLRKEFLEAHGQTIEEVNPTPGNKAGGITTLVEKSMGNIKKMGVSPVQGLIYAGEDIPHPGLWVLDLRADGPDSNSTTGFAMSGAVMTVFSTGRGTPMGNAVMPVLKLTGNPGRYEKLAGILDFNAGVVLEGADIKKTAETLYEMVIEVAEGKETKSEQNGDFEYTIPRENSRK
ncbi:MAG: UxaA family hydrolase [Lachnospiraceae bacterium]|nr:UxaA family hydrolase [Lachnospiraceae bacterium]